MTVINDILKEMKTTDLTQKVREFCDIIMNEERPKFKFPDLLPKGPNIFLSLEVPGRSDKEIGFLTLEREGEEDYLIVYHTLETYRITTDPENMIPPRRRKVWPVSENKAEKILAKFAKTVKILRGE
jgi:hypothetical protein